MMTHVLQDRFEHMLQQRHYDIVTQPAGLVGSPQQLTPQTVNMTLSDYGFPSSPTRSYGLRFENGVLNDRSDIDLSLRAGRELKPQEPITSCPDLNLFCHRAGSRDIAADNWQSQSRHSRTSVSSNLDAPHVITCTTADESNLNLSGRFDQPLNLDPSLGSISADIELHL